MPKKSFRFLKVVFVVLFLLSSWGITPAQAKANTPASFLPPGLLGPEFAISVDTTPAGDSQHQQVAYNPKHNEYLVVYDVIRPGFPKEVFARRISGSGQALNGFAIAADSADNYDPAIAYDPINDRYLVVWSASYNGDFPKYDIYGRLVSWDGIMLSTPGQIYTWNDRSFINSQVVWNSVEQEFLVAWTALVFTTGLINDVAIVRVNADGVRINLAMLLATTGYPDEVDLAYQPANDQILAAWSEDYARSPTDIGRRVSVTVLNHDLSVAFSAHSISDCTDQANHNDPVIIPFASGRYIAACMQRGIGYQGNGTNTIELDEDGNELSSGVGVNSISDFGTQDMASIPGTQEWLHVYDERISENGPQEIFGLRESHNSMGWTDTISEINRDLRNPRLSPDNPGLIVYQGKQVGTTDPWRIYGRVWIPWPVFIPVVMR